MTDYTGIGEYLAHVKDTERQPTRYTMIPIEVRVPVDLRHDQDVAGEIALAAQESANENYGRDYDDSEPEPVSSPARRRLEAIRASLQAENISYGELAELQSLAPHIEPGDTELLEAAGVPEYQDQPEITTVRGAQIRVFDRAPGTDDASDMYVMEVLGTTVRVRLVTIEGTDEDEPDRAEPFVTVEAGGQFTVSVNEDRQPYND